jgi:hypothetical protein
VKKVFKFGCFGVLGLIGLFVVLGMIGAAISPDTETTGTRTETLAAASVSNNNLAVLAPTNTAVSAAPVDTPVPPTAEPVFTIGTDVMVGDVRWKFLSAENLGNVLTSGNQFIEDKTTAGKFIKVRFEMENRSNDMLTYTGINLVDSQGRSFTDYSEQYMYLPDNETCTFIENLNPNVPRACTVIFEVAPDAVGLQANVGDFEMFGSAEAFINLGF